MKKLLVASAALVAGFFVSCGGDSGTSGSSEKNEEPSKTLEEELGPCDEDSEGDVVETDSVSYRCGDDGWEEYEEGSSSSVVQDTIKHETKDNSSSSKKEVLSSSSEKTDSVVVEKPSSSSVKDTLELDKLSSSSEADTAKTDSTKSSSSEEISSSSVLEYSSSTLESSESQEISSSSEEVFSSSSIPANWSWDIPKEAYFNKKIKYDILIDTRDNQVYKTVSIGNQIWMAENLNYADSVKTESLKGSSWCFNDIEENCNIAGRLYSWAAAIDSVKLANDISNPQKCGNDQVCNLPYPLQGICPNGWHVPNNDDWIELLMFLSPIETSGKKLKSQIGWNQDENGVDRNGSDDYGFSAIPVGVCYNFERGQYRHGFDNDGVRSFFWSASEWDVNMLGHADETHEGVAHFFGVENKYDSMVGSAASKIYGLPVRCIKD